MWLMRHGSSQSAIAEFGHARLSAVQRDILGEALHKTARLRHEGLSIGTVQLYTGRGFVTGMAAVAEELIALMSLDVMLLCVVHQNAKGQPFLSLIGRASSRASAVNLNEVPPRPDHHPSPPRTRTRTRTRARTLAQTRTTGPGHSTSIRNGRPRKFERNSVSHHQN